MKLITQKQAKTAFNERGFDMIGVYVNSKTPVLLRDNKCGYEWKASYANVIIAGGGCPKCAGKARITEEEAIKAFNERGFDLIGEYVNVRTPVLLCDKKCGHEWKASYDNVINKGRGCPKCAGKARITEEEAITVFDERGFDMIGDYVNTQKPVLLMDRKCGHEWKASYISVINNGTGCPKCAKHGFNPSESAILYLIHNKQEEAYKIGITTTKNKNRLIKWNKQGWYVCYTLEHKTGNIIKLIETNILNWWRNELNLPIFLKNGEGYTETVDASLIEKEIIWDKINFFYNSFKNSI